MTADRADLHRELSAFLASRNDIELAALVDEGRAVARASTHGGNSPRMSLSPRRF